MKRLSMLALAVSAFSFSSAQTLYSTSFEGPTFVPGALFNGTSGQDGWQSTTTTGLIVTAENGATPWSGTQMHRLDSRVTTTGGLGRWSWVDVSTQWGNRTSGNDLAMSTHKFYIPATNSVDGSFGIQHYNLAVDVLAQADFNPSNNELTIIGDTSGWIYTFNLTKDAWNEIMLVNDMVNGGVYAYINGIFLPDPITVSPSLLTSFADADLFTFANANQANVGTVYHDAYSVVATNQLPSVITGNIVFNDYTGPAITSVDVEIREAGTQTVIASGSIPVAPNGDYGFIGPLIENVDVSIKPGKWLRQTLNANLLNGPVNGLSFSLTNGDIDNDNAVTVFDYGILSDYFDKTSTDGDWATVGGNGFAPKDADIDGDESVTVFDYGILSDNFDKSGDA